MCSAVCLIFDVMFCGVYVAQTPVLYMMVGARVLSETGVCHACLVVSSCAKLCLLERARARLENC
jgi:hypothetical protein